MSERTVLVSGCFDLLHPGHVAFLSEAAGYGALHVALGSDANVSKLKGRPPMFSQDERVYMVKSLACVENAFVAGGSGVLDFVPDLERIRPDVFVVNSDGHTRGKEDLCARHGIEYRVLDRIPAENFPARSSTDSKAALNLPYRVCLAGGWIDQPWVSEHAPGSVVVVAIEPTIRFNDRSGMATSTRRTAAELWDLRWPVDRFEHHAKTLFACDNPPGTKYVSGSQDAIGLVYPGINRLYYDGKYWPEHVDSCIDREIAQWLESVVHLVPLAPRPDGYDPLKEQNLTAESVRPLAAAGDLCWESIVKRDVEGLGRALTETALGWREILPRTIDDRTLESVREFSIDHAGACPSGCGGGYMIVITEAARVSTDAVRIRVRLPN